MRQCRRGCWRRVCTRGAWWALLDGPSTSPLDVAMDERTHLIGELQRVFPPVVVSERAAPHVCPECDHISEVLGQRNWTQVPSTFISANPGVLPLLSETAYVAYLPAWLREGLEHPDEFVASMLFINLGDSPPAVRFTPEQGLVIVAVARAMLAASWCSDDPVRREEVNGIERKWARSAV